MDDYVVIKLVMFWKLLVLSEWLKQNSEGYVKVGFIHCAIVRVISFM